MFQTHQQIQCAGAAAVHWPSGEAWHCLQSVSELIMLLEQILPGAALCRTGDPAARSAGAEA